ncbi:hypothetical protein GGD66_007381 [Bradyrhizobium sp. CIR48]|uniref:hypothetical protein n=1 Tax=Bradyrhizobium sp. CIR48 TaxID=2663840 RepID=UPI0016068FE6|nr:hypothetical protein [Bradyrhizobium sp. CIR48]MBB4428786.1 hypothetical protein [Bradyrhizobium sp. CIR48]
MPWPSSPTSNRYLVLLADTLASAVVTLVLSVFAWGFVGSTGQGGLFLVMFVPGLLALFAGLLLVPFVVGPIYGMAKGRLGFLFGPVLLAAVVYPLSSLALRHKEETIAALAVTTAEPVRTDHNLLAIDDEDFCKEGCVRVLANSAYTIALRGDYWQRSNDPRWTLYRQATGAACLAKENVELAFDFLRLGYPGKCAVREPIDHFDDGLWLRKRSPNPRFRLPPDLPPGLPKDFNGTVYEYFERIGGEDRLLARHIKGGLLPEASDPLILIEKRPKAIDVGPKMDTNIFLAKAIKGDAEQFWKPADPFPFDETWTGIESYFGRKERYGAGTIEDAAALQWMGIARLARQQAPQLLKQRVLGLFASRDPFRVKVGLLHWTYDIPSSDRIFVGADNVIFDLTFVAVEERSWDLEMLLQGQFPAGGQPVSTEIRERAKAHLSDPDLKPWQRQFLMRIGRP